MPVRGPFVRLLRSVGLLCAGALAVVGGLGLRGPALVAVGVAAALAACAAVGIARDARPGDGLPVVEAAIQAAAWTAGVLLGLAGVAVLAGGLVALLAAAGVATAWLLLRAARPGGGARGSGGPSVAPSWPVDVDVLLLPVPPEDGPADRTPVTALTTPALGREWIRTTAALGGRLPPADRAALVRRREETLDELERRDAAGFARWLADGPAPDSDPATYLRGRPVQEDPTAGTDAA